MQPATFPLELYRGDTEHMRFRFYSGDGTTPIDLTGATAKSEIRDRPAGGIIVSLICTVILPNIVDVVLSAQESPKLPITTKGCWDLQITLLSGTVLTPVSGKVTVT